MTEREYVKRPYQRRPVTKVKKPKDTTSQGIVRDLRGQEQPADKERAQRTVGDGRASGSRRPA